MGIAINTKILKLSDYNAACPRFMGVEELGLENELLDLERLKQQKDSLQSWINNIELRLKNAFKAISPEGQWVSAQSMRFKVATCDGRRTLDKDLLLHQLGNSHSIDTAEMIVQSSYKTSSPYERLYVSPINRA